jgi:DNA polymerase-3 subunit epsilon
MSVAEHILIFDTETTGLTLHPDAEMTKQPRMIEFGGVLMSRKDGAVLEEVSIMINPGVKLEAIITKITGITDADLADAPPFGVVLPQLRRVFAEADCVMAHNLPFDRAILKGELARLHVLDFPWPKYGVCTVGLYREHWGRNPKLTELYEAVMGKPLAQTHRALDDVNAMVEIIQKEQLWRLA